MIRITSRKEDIDRAIIFANKLRDKTELDIASLRKLVSRNKLQQERTLRMLQIN